jgi:hypothetical protein
LTSRSQKPLPALVPVAHASSFFSMHFTHASASKTHAPCSEQQQQRPQRALAKQKVAAAKAIGAAAGAGAAMGAAMGRRHSSWGVVKMAEGFEVANT